MYSLCSVRKRDNVFPIKVNPINLVIFKLKSISLDYSEFK